MKNKKTVICSDVFGNKFETDVSELQMVARVYGIIIKNNEILLTKQWDGYGLPGGGIEIGEKISETFEREIREETGYIVKMNKIIDFEMVFYRACNKNKSVQAFMFYCTHKNLAKKVLKQKLTESEKQFCSGYEWIKLDDLEKIIFRHSGDIKRIIKNVLVKQD